MSEYLLRTIFVTKYKHLRSLLPILIQYYPKRSWKLFLSLMLNTCTRRANSKRSTCTLIHAFYSSISELSRLHLRDIYPAYRFPNWIKTGQAPLLHIHTFNALIHSMRVISRTPTCITYPRWFRSQRGGSHTYIRAEIPAQMELVSSRFILSLSLKSIKSLRFDSGTSYSEAATSKKQALRRGM